MSPLNTGIGRRLLGVAFIAFGLNHIVGVRDLVVIVPTFLPGGALWVYVTGAAFLAAGVSFVGDVLVRRAALLLALMFLVFITTVHLPALFQAESLAAARGAGFGVFQDLAFVGAALLLAERDHSP